MRWLVALLIFPVISYAVDYSPSCIGTQNFPAVTAYNYMTRQLAIPVKDIDESKTKVSFIDKQTITKLMGETVVEQEMNRSWGLTPEAARKMLRSTFIDEKVYVLTIKVDFQNFSGKNNSFIVTSFTNDEECSVDEAGLILLNRGF